MGRFDDISTPSLDPDLWDAPRWLDAEDLRQLEDTAWRPSRWTDEREEDR